MVSKKAPVGDLDSKARGTAARFNEGKVPLELVDLDVIYQSMIDVDPFKPVVQQLAIWQHGGSSKNLLTASYYLASFLAKTNDDKSFGGIPWDECARVFEYGAKKYCEWNWLKGQAWSVPFACAVRHLDKIYKGQLIDEESGQTHMGHFLCNVVMLCYYEKEYKEGDNRPPFLANVEEH